jgi:2-dehydropantoate 2-reductase
MEPVQRLTVLVVGLGALGTVFGTMLKKAGHRVLALTRDGHLDALRSSAVGVTGIWGEHRADLDGIYGSTDALGEEKFDLILLTVKSYDTEEAVRKVTSLVGKDTLVLVVQNGYGNYETVAAIVGKERTLLGRVIFGSKLLSPGEAEVTVIADDVRIGQPEEAVAADRIVAISGAIRKAGIPCAYADDIYQILWDKILYNAALNPLGAILECTYGDLAGKKGSRVTMNAVVGEIFDVAAAHAIELRWDSPEQYLEHFYTRLVPPTAAHFPSMYYDLKAGKRLEIDALNGAVVKLGRQRRVPVPVNETITNLIKAKESLSQ